MIGKVKYRDYYIVFTGDGYDVVEFNGELVDGGFTSVDDCKRFIDNHIDA